MTENRRSFRLTLASQDTLAFLDACRAVDWDALDTGERIMTEDGPDGEAIVMVQPFARASFLEAAAIAR